MRKLISALFLAELVSLTNAFQLQLATVSPAGDEDEVTEVVEKVDAGETVPIVDEEVIEYAEEEGVDTEAEKEEYSEVTTVCVTADGEEYNSEECDCDPEQPDSGVQTYCYTDKQITESYQSGYWYEMCNEINLAANLECSEDVAVDAGCMADNLIYYAQMYQSMELYVALLSEEAYQEEQYLLCSENYAQGWNVSEELYYNALDAIDIEKLYDDSEWNYRIDEEAIDIKGKITFDMELYFTVNQARGLYNIYAPEYEAICEAASGLYEPFTRENYESQEDFELAIASIISQLESFDYLSEDEDALVNLYYVCVNDNVFHITLADDEQLLEAESLEDTVVKTTDSNVFLELYPTFEDFQSLYT